MKKTFMVSGMHCKSCEMLIKDVLEETDGVSNAEASTAKGNVIVEYDEKKVDEKKIRQLIKEQGYEAK